MALASIPSSFIFLFIAAMWAGAQNALAGGGSFVTLPALMLTGMDARAANITSTIALFPAQLATGWTGRKLVTDVGDINFRTLVVVCLLGGALGAVLLLVTPAIIFAKLVPWLVLVASAIFAYGSFAPRHTGLVRLSGWSTIAVQFLIAIYGGYFGGGIGFLMLAALTAAGLAIRAASANKNMLAGAMNASAVAIFAFSPETHWLQALVACTGAVIGGVVGGLMVTRVNEKILRGVVVVVGIALTIGLFLRAPR